MSLFEGRVAARPRARQLCQRTIIAPTAADRLVREFVSPVGDQGSGGCAACAAYGTPVGVFFWACARPLPLLTPVDRPTSPTCPTRPTLHFRSTWHLAVRQLPVHSARPLRRSAPVAKKAAGKPAADLSWRALERAGKLALT